MSERCSCGAQLVDGALFCHRCGKPQREDLVEHDAPAREAVAEALPEPTALPTSPIAAEFSPRRATRAALAAAVLAFVAMSILVQLIGTASVLISLVLAGALTVYLYRRSDPDGLSLTTRLGARIGWTTGVFAFLLFLVQMTLGIVFSGGSIRDMFLRQIEEQAVNNPALNEAVALLNSSAGMAAFLATTLVVVFITCTVLTTIGGMLGVQLGSDAKRS